MVMRLGAAAVLVGGVGCSLFGDYTTAPSSGGGGAGGNGGGGAGLGGSLAGGGFGGATGGGGGLDCPTECDPCEADEDCWTLEPETESGNALCGEPADLDDVTFVAVAPDVLTRVHDLTSYYDAARSETFVLATGKSVVIGPSGPAETAFVGSSGGSSSLGLAPPTFEWALAAETVAVGELVLVDPTTPPSLYALGGRKGQPQGFTASSPGTTAFAATFALPIAAASVPTIVAEPIVGSSRALAATLTTPGPGTERRLSALVMQTASWDTGDPLTHPELAVLALPYASDGSFDVEVLASCDALEPEEVVQLGDPNRAGAASFLGPDAYFAVSGCGEARLFRVPPSGPVSSLPFAGSVDLAGVEAAGPRLVVAGTFSGTLSVSGETLTSVGQRDVFIAVLDEDLALERLEQLGGMGDMDVLAMTVSSTEQDQHAVYLGGWFTGDAYWGCFGGFFEGSNQRAFVAKVSLGLITANEPMVPLYFKPFGSTGDSKITALHKGAGQLWLAGILGDDATIDLTPSDERTGTLSAPTDGATFLAPLQDDTITTSP
jgi:hypothetical protein